MNIHHSKIHNGKKHFPNLSNSHHRQASLLRPIYSQIRATWRNRTITIYYSVPKHHNHNPRSLKLGYSRTIHCPSSSKKEIFERVIESHGKFNPRRPRASRSHCGRSSIDNELCPLDTWVSSTMKTAEVHVIRD